MTGRDSSDQSYQISSRVVSKRLRIKGGVRVAKNTIKYNLTRLLALSGVKYVTIGWKKIRGEKTSIVAIKVYVLFKIEKVARTQRVPRRLRARDSNGRQLSFFIPTDVNEEPGESSLLQNLLGGDRAFHISVGTIACRYHIQDGRGYCLTNAHVVSRLDGASSNERVRYLDEGGIERQIGQVEKFSRLRGNGIVNTMDAASVTIETTPSGADWEVRYLDGQIKGDIERLKAGGQGEYSYRSGGQRIDMRNPEFVGHGMVLLFGGAPVWYRNFFAFDVVSEEHPQKGHSGALLVRRVGGEYRAAGLVFGADVPYGTKVYVFDLREAFDFLHPV